MVLVAGHTLDGLDILEEFTSEISLDLLGVSGLHSRDLLRDDFILTKASKLNEAGSGGADHSYPRRVSLNNVISLI
jgi:hypothetical protein